MVRQGPSIVSLTFVSVFENKMLKYKIKEETSSETERQQHFWYGCAFLHPQVRQSVPLEITYDIDTRKSREFCQDVSRVRIFSHFFYKGQSNFQYMHVTYNSPLQELQHFPLKYLVLAAHSLVLISNPLSSGIANNFRKLGQCGI